MKFKRRIKRNRMSFNMLFRLLRKRKLLTGKHSLCKKLKSKRNRRKSKKRKKTLFKGILLLPRSNKLIKFLMLFKEQFNQPRLRNLLQLRHLFNRNQLNNQKLHLFKIPHIKLIMIRQFKQRSPKPKNRKMEKCLEVFFQIWPHHLRARLQMSSQLLSSISHHHLSIHHLMKNLSNPKSLRMQLRRVKKKSRNKDILYQVDCSTIYQIFNQPWAMKVLNKRPNQRHSWHHTLWFRKPMALNNFMSRTKI